MLKTAHMVRLVDVRRALGRILQVGAALRRVHVSGRCQEALQEGALACSMGRVKLTVMHVATTGLGQAGTQSCHRSLSSYDTYSICACVVVLLDSLHPLAPSLIKKLVALCSGWVCLLTEMAS